VLRQLHAEQALLSLLHQLVVLLFAVLDQLLLVACELREESMLQDEQSSGAGAHQVIHHPLAGTLRRAVDHLQCRE